MSLQDDIKLLRDSCGGHTGPRVDAIIRVCKEVEMLLETAKYAEAVCGICEDLKKGLGGTVARLSWQPIDTVPKSCESVMLCGPDGEQVVGYWNNHYGHGVVDFNGASFHATHWMPLPEPPK